MAVRPLRLDDEEYEIVCFDKNKLAIRNTECLRPFHDLIDFYYNKNDFLRKVRESTNKLLRIILPYYLLIPNEENDLRDLQQLVTDLNAMDQIHSIYLYYRGTFNDFSAWMTNYNKLINVEKIETDLHKKICEVCYSICEQLDNYYIEKQKICLRDHNLSAMNSYEEKQIIISSVQQQYMEDKYKTTSTAAQNIERNLQTKKRKLTDLQQQADIRLNRPPIQDPNPHTA